MFTSIVYLMFNSDDECNVYELYDSCFMHTIVSPYQSPSLKNTENRLGNTLTMLSIAKHYETLNRNIALNLAYYYKWLHYNRGFYIDKAFIKKQFTMIDKAIPNMNFYKKYFHNTCHYLHQHSLCLE